MEALKAFHNDAKIKAKYIARVRAHRKADELVQGVGWESNGTTRGCAVGCTLQAYDHSRYPIELGLPEWLARLEDHLFEALPKAEALKWPEAFLKAIPVGVDVEPVRHKLAIRRLDRLIALQTGNLGKHGTAIDAVIQQTVAAIEKVKALHHAEVDGKNCPVDFSAAASAESAAWSAAAASAESAARSAAESAAWAWSAASRSAAAWSAESAARSAESAAWSAASAAAWAAESAAVKQEAKDLLELLAECK